MEAKVSIVLPVYNGEKYLASAIESILAQTYRNWELIIVDDCSTDRSAEIMEKYRVQDSRIQIVRNKENRKLPGSLNAGFSKAEGKYYTWTSDDNLLKPEMLAVLVNAMEEDKSLGLVYGDFIRIDAEGKEIDYCEMEDPEKLAAGINAVGACFLYRADIAERVGGYDADLFLVEDYDYWLRFFFEASIKKVPQVLYYYRLHSGSLTETRKESIRKQTFRLIQKYYKEMMERIEEPELGYFLKERLLTLADEKERQQLLADFRRENKSFIRWYRWKNFKRNLRRKLGRLKRRLFGRIK